MALLFMDGFDLADTSVKWTSVSNPGSSAITRFSTGKSLYLAPATANVQIGLPASAQIYIGFALNRDNLGASYEFVKILADNGTMTHLSVFFTPSGAVSVSRGGTTIATSVNGIVFASTWTYIEVMATIADAGGQCIVRVNGVTVINFTGDTKNGGTSTNIDTIVLMGTSGGNSYFDDFYVCDASGSAPYNGFLGEMRIYALSPTGAGSSTQWTPDTGSNYARVNEVPYSASNYVQSGTSGQRDTYTMADLPATVGTILGVQNNVIAKRTDATAVSIKPAIKSGTTVYYGSTVVLTASDRTLTDLRTTDPNTATAWTASGVNALEGGFEVA